MLVPALHGLAAKHHQLGPNDLLGARQHHGARHHLIAASCLQGLVFEDRGLAQGAAVQGSTGRCGRDMPSASMLRLQHVHLHRTQQVLEESQVSLQKRPSALGGGAREATPIHLQPLRVHPAFLELTPEVGVGVVVFDAVAADVLGHERGQGFEQLAGLWPEAGEALFCNSRALLLGGVLCDHH